MTDLPEGETPFKNADQYQRPFPRRLLSGNLLKVEDSRRFALVSEDDGQTWDCRGPINAYDFGREFGLPDVEIQIENGPHRGRLIVPTYFEMDGDHPDYTRAERGGYAIHSGKKIFLQTHTHVPELAGSYMCCSDDEGKTWHNSNGFLLGYINDGQLGHWTCEEPVVAELKDGRVLCYMRSTCGCILKSYSSDGGASWSKVELTDIPMSNSPCVLLRLPQSGDLVMVWNPMSPDEIKRGYRRGRLTVAVSTDDGETWIHRRNLEVSDGIEDITDVRPPAQPTPMVRGGCGPDDILGEIADGFTHFHYPNIFLDGDDVLTGYIVSPLGEQASYRWRRFTIAELH